MKALANKHIFGAEHKGIIAIIIVYFGKRLRVRPIYKHNDGGKLVNPGIFRIS